MSHVRSLMHYVDSDVLQDYNKFLTIFENYYQDAGKISMIMGHFHNHASELRNSISDMNQGIHQITEGMNTNSQALKFYRRTVVRIFDFTGFHRRTDCNL
jgi:hypothetical protein